MKRLIPVKTRNDILQQYRDTPVGVLLEYHNLQKPFESYTSAQLLVGICMDNRISLRIPDNFAYIMRTGGENLHHKEFNISYAIGVGNIRYIALIGHDRCGMSNLKTHRDDFINGIVANAGWTREKAAKHFDHDAPIFEIGDEIEYTLKEVKRLREYYPAIVIAPMFYLMSEKLICHIIE